MLIKQIPLNQLQEGDSVSHLVYLTGITLRKNSKSLRNYLIMEVSDSSHTMTAYRWSPTPSDTLCVNASCAIISGTVDSYRGKKFINISAMVLSPLLYSDAEIEAILGPNPSKKSPIAGPKTCDCSMKDLLSHGCSCGGC